MTRSGRWSIAVWLAGLLVCALLIVRADFTADLSAFLPRSPSTAQQVLVDQLRDGVVSRLVLVAVEGAPPDALADLSRDTASRLRGDPLITAVDNGETTGIEADRAYLGTTAIFSAPPSHPHGSPSRVCGTRWRTISACSSPPVACS